MKNFLPLTLLTLVVVAVAVVVGLTVPVEAPAAPSKPQSTMIAVYDADGEPVGIFHPEELTDFQLLDDHTVSEEELAGTEPDGAQPAEWYETHTTTIIDY